MDRNKIIQLFLTLFVVLSVSLKAQDLSNKQYYDPNLRFALPADCKVKMNWIIAPIEDSVVKKASIYALSFGVDLYKQPWIGFHNEEILNLAMQYQFKLSPNYESFTFLENGAFLVANENDLGYVVAPNSKTKDYNNRITAQFQPIATLPIHKSKLYPGAGNCLFLSEKNEDSGLYEIYLLTPEKSSTGTSIKQYKKVYSSEKPITGIAGDSTTVYIASYQLLLKLNTKDGSISKIPANSTNGGIKGLAYNAQSGLFYCTEFGVGFVGANTCIPFLSCTEPQIYLRGGTLYVLISKTMGVLSFDNVGDLKRFDRPVEQVPSTNSTEVKPTMVRFFEGPSPAQPIPDRKYAVAFGKDTTRFIYGEITLQNLLYQKQPNKQIVEMVLTRPFSYGWESQKVFFDFGLNNSSLMGWFQFGNGVLGSNYPGEYTMTTYLNNIKLDTRNFKVNGNVTVVEAAAHKDTLKLRELIRNGADVNYKNEYGTSALIQIAIMGDLESSKMLIDRGADVNARNSSGESPLITACMRYSDNAPIVKLLLDHKADVNAADKDKETPLIKALTNYNTSPEIVKMLIDAGADVNVKDAKGQTPISSIGLWSNNKSNGQVMEMLLKKGADPNVKNEDGIPLIFTTISATSLDCLKALINSGVDPNTFGKNNGVTDFDKDHSVLWCLLDKYIFTTSLTDKQRIMETIEFLYDKGGRLTREEELQEPIMYGSLWKYLPNRMIYDVIGRQGESIQYYQPKDTLLQKAIIFRLISLAYTKIFWAASDDDYFTAQYILKNASERAKKFNLIFQFPEIYFDLGLLNITLGDKKESEQYLNNYLEIAPYGSLSSKAKALLRKTE